MPKWRLAGQCPAFSPERPAISVGGINPMGLRWVPLDEPEIVIPNSPSGGHWARIYEIREAGSCVRFAAYLSDDKMWSFYVPSSSETSETFEAASAKYEGHWRRSADQVSALPWPMPDPTWIGRASFLARLGVLETAAQRVRYRGYSACRLCGKLNGSEGLRWGGWEWPSGFRHYVADHDVKPSGQFEAFVMCFSPDQMISG